MGGSLQRLISTRTDMKNRYNIHATWFWSDVWPIWNLKSLIMNLLPYVECAQYWGWHARKTSRAGSEQYVSSWMTKTTRNGGLKQRSHRCTVGASLWCHLSQLHEQVSCLICGWSEIMFIMSVYYSVTYGDPNKVGFMCRVNVDVDMDSHKQTSLVS